VALVTSAEAWIDLLLKRGPELRRAGVLSIGADGLSAVLAPADPVVDDSDDDSATTVEDEPANPWERGESYPNGIVPRIDVDEKLPEIPDFGDG
jgi:hypothetical protein